MPFYPALDSDLEAVTDLMTLRDRPHGDLLGTVWLEPATPPAWRLGMPTVRPDLQARQIGRASLDSAELLVRSWGAQRVGMTVLDVRYPLIACYGYRGYHQTGEVQAFPYHDSPFGDPRRDDLAFVVLEKALFEVGEPQAPLIAQTAQFQ